MLNSPDKARYALKLLYNNWNWPSTMNIHWYVCRTEDVLLELPSAFFDRASWPKDALKQRCTVLKLSELRSKRRQEADDEEMARRIEAEEDADALARAKAVAQQAEDAEAAERAREIAESAAAATAGSDKQSGTNMPSGSNTPSRPESIQHSQPTSPKLFNDEGIPEQPQPAPLPPTFQVPAGPSANCNLHSAIERQDWLCSGIDGIAATTEEAADQLQESLQSSHQDMWPAACKFFGVDPARIGARERFTIKHLVKGNKMKPYQILAAAYLLRELARQESCTILLLRMGFGKGVIAVAVSKIWNSL